jgi:hypothetical protein
MIAVSNQLTDLLPLVPDALTSLATIRARDVVEVRGYPKAQWGNNDAASIESAEKLAASQFLPLQE